MPKNMLLALCALIVATPALAQETAPPPAEAAPVAASAAPSLTVSLRRGNTIYSADGRRIGRIDRLSDDGSPRVIFNGAFVTIPVATLTRSGDRLVTSLTRREVSALD